MILTKRSWADDDAIGIRREHSRGELSGNELSLTCPEVTRRMAEIQKLTITQTDASLLSLTVDPRTDTPSVLSRWGTRFGADTDRWHFLTGDQTKLYGLIGTSFLAQDSGDPLNSMPGNIARTERIAVVDVHGRTRIYFDGLQSDTPAAVVAEIAQLRRSPRTL